MLFGPKGPAVELLKRMKKNKALRRVRFSVRGSGNCTKIVFGIAQVHPVLTGRFEKYQVRRIANVQAEILGICRCLHDDYRIRSFGQEGFAGKGRARLPQEFLRDMRNAHGNRLAAKSTLKSAAYKWRKALHAGHGTEAGKYATMLNALTVLQALEDDVSVYPIEQADVHGAIGRSMAEIQHALSELEATPAFSRASAKGGKGLTNEEYEAMKARNDLVHQFNNVIKHPERDRSILRQVVDHASGKLSVFILGAGHKAGMLRLAAKHIPKGTMFVWAEPPRLWWWKATVYRGFWLLIGLATFTMFVALR